MTPRGSPINIYAPNDLQQQLAFLRNLNNFLVTNVDIGNLIVGGDWNVTLEAVDKKGGSQWKPTSYRNQLISMMKEFSLIDVYRILIQVSRVSPTNPKL